MTERKRNHEELNDQLNHKEVCVCVRVLVVYVFFFAHLEMPNDPIIFDMEDWS